MEDDKNEKDRQIIEDYLREHAIESVLDEVINNVIERRPDNPYVELSKLLETKTKPDIIEVTIVSVLAGGCNFAVRVTIITNVGSYFGEAAFPYQPITTLPVTRDFTAERVKIEDAIKNLSPLNFPQLEEALYDLHGVDPPILLAASIACLRGATKFHGLPLYQYIAQLASSEPQIPLPVCTALTRCVGDISTMKTTSSYQSFSLYPIVSTSFSQGIESLLQGVDRINRELFIPLPPPTPVPEVVAPPAPTGKKGAAAPSPAAAAHAQQALPPPQVIFPQTIPMNGSMCIVKQTLDTTLKTLYSALRTEPSLLPHLRLSTDYKAANLFKMAVPKGSKGEPVPGAEEEAFYGFNGVTEPYISGVDTVDLIINQWKEYQFVSIEDPLYQNDIRSLRLLKERMAHTLESLREEPPNPTPNHPDHSYTLKGVGGDESCNLQISADKSSTQSEDLRKYANEAVYNAINIRFDKIGSIMKAIDICKTAHEIGWSIIISTSKETPETMDTFLSDFAVGVGSSQFQIGGLHAIEYGMKFNRILEIAQENDQLQYLGNNFRK